MKRLISSKNGRESYGSKWQNTESSSDTESDDHGLIHSAETAQSPNHEHNENQIGQAPVGSNETAPTITHHEDKENQIGRGNKKRRVSDEAETMYRAAVEGDWLAAEILLSRNPNLARDYVTDEGERALHVAAAMKHEKFAEKLIDQMNEDDLLLLDGRGYTALCYAVASGAAQIAAAMIIKNRKVIITRDKNNVTQLQKAVLRGNMKAVSLLLPLTENENLSNEEWFDLFLVTIREKMFDVALELVEKINFLATMVKEERTALHVLAQLDISNIVSNTWRFRLLQIVFGVDVTEFVGKKPSNFVKLAEKLWSEMQKMDKTSLLELIKTHHILHDATKSGHVELLTMLTRTYPQLIWDADSNGHTIFHIAVAYRQHHVFYLIHQAKAMIHTATVSQDQDGNNILHLSAKLSLRPLYETRLPPVALMQRELEWFEMTKRVVPPSCEEMRNIDGLTPRELFSKEHKRLLRESKTWMRNSADSYMLIATIVFSVLFASAFAIPGGYNSETGKAILSKSKSFENFVRGEVGGLAFSVISILLFSYIMTSTLAENDFRTILPLIMRFGLESLVGSLIAAVIVFISLFQLVCGKFLEQHTTDVLIYAYCVWVSRNLVIQYYWSIYTLVKSIRGIRHSLFNQHPTASTS
ncbi:hypothetical protein C2S53_017720 [Perilla frutescens var. hirtella]|uniref:PGG domain-containing protein n=1 Tax=Perilla frutescens var. hirtella TaxID=608512 RepID=A0AAD4IVL4_PERFH|nr:hypothetical protein C2S53_017720 [Perilla frutescens var. hirtella]